MLTDFHGNEAKKIPKWPIKKTEFFNSANSQYSFSKISWIGLWVSRMSTMSINVLNLYGHEDVRHKHENGLKTQKCIFCLFLSICRTPSRIYSLNHINALCINQSYQLKDQSMKFSKKIENGGSWKTQLFWIGKTLNIFWWNFLHESDARHKIINCWCF